MKVKSYDIPKIASDKLALFAKRKKAKLPISLPPMYIGWLMIVRKIEQQCSKIEQRGLKWKQK